MFIFSWGENGYIRILRNGSNHGGIANHAMYPATDINIDERSSVTLALFITISILGTLSFIIVIITVILCYRSCHKKKDAECRLHKLTLHCNNVSAINLQSK